MENVGRRGAVIFDVDGTLADSLPPHVDFCRTMNEELDAGLQLPEASDLDACRALAAAPMDNFLRRAGFAEREVEIAVQRYERSFAEEFPVRLFKGVPEMLQQLAREPGLLLAVVSSNTSKNVRACLAQHSDKPLAEYFEFIWGIDNAARSKADSLAQAVAQLGLAPQQIVYIGDTAKDARCAQKCGMQFIGANWGGFEDMGRLASATAVAGDAEELEPFVALRSPSQVFDESLGLINSGAVISSHPTQSRSLRSLEQVCVPPNLDATSPIDAASWWSFLWFSWMTPLYDKKGEDLKLEVEAEAAFQDWTTPRNDAPEAQAAKLQRTWDDSGDKASLLNAFWAIYGCWWLRIASLKLVGMVSVVGTPLLIKAFLGQLQIHTATSADTMIDDENRWPFGVLLVLVPTMTACSFLYTFMWHQ